MNTTLYRFYDQNERLLYVGISGNPGRRFHEHSKDKGWWAQVARSTMEHHPTREEAAAAEVAAIITERPLHNIVHGGRSLEIPTSGRGKRYVHNDGCFGSGPMFFYNKRGGHCHHDDLALAPEPHLSPAVDNVYGESDDTAEQGRIEVEYWFDYLTRDNHGQMPETCTVYWSITGDNTCETAPFPKAWGCSWPDSDNFLTHFTWPRDMRTGQMVNFLRLPIRHRFKNFARTLGYNPSPLQATYPVGTLADPDLWVRQRVESGDVQEIPAHLYQPHIHK